MTLWGHSKTGRVQGKLYCGRGQPVSIQHNHFYPKWQLQPLRNIGLDKPCQFCDSSFTCLLPHSRHRDQVTYSESQSTAKQGHYIWVFLDPGISKIFLSMRPSFLSVIWIAASVSSTKEKVTEVNKPTKVT